MDAETKAAVGDLAEGTARSLAVICRYLVEAKVLDLNMLIGELADLQVDFENEKTGPYAAAVPVRLRDQMRRPKASKYVPPRRR